MFCGLPVWIGVKAQSLLHGRDSNLAKTACVVHTVVYTDQGNVQAYDPNMVLPVGQYNQLRSELFFTILAIVIASIFAKALPRRRRPRLHFASLSQQCLSARHHGYHVALLVLGMICFCDLSQQQQPLACVRAAPWIRQPCWMEGWQTKGVLFLFWTRTCVGSCEAKYLKLELRFVFPTFSGPIFMTRAHCFYDILQLTSR